MKEWILKKKKNVYLYIFRMKIERIKIIIYLKFVQPSEW